MFSTSDSKRSAQNFVVDRLPSSFVNDPDNFTVLLGKQINKFWLASGPNFLFHEAFLLHENGNVNGFFDGTFFYVCHLNADMETFALATCIKRYTAGKEERYEGIKNIIEDQSHEFDLDNFSLEWTDHKELMLKREGIPVTCVQEKQVDEFKKLMDCFCDEANLVSKAIKTAKKRERRESKAIKASEKRKRREPRHSRKSVRKDSSKGKDEPIVGLKKERRFKFTSSVRNLFGLDQPSRAAFNDSGDGLWIVDSSTNMYAMYATVESDREPSRTRRGPVVQMFRS